ncbi:hemolysin-type calcium binding protein [Rubellimicrobium mesophilum DSM 19309]|uniref:Hemolysin-type calcium binding protein n=1 Tax=Rubellimicrobium mesophilum DSM 19309 TaxID=442562 RepID=A0A017HJ34_9RHOB|nr:calcium-binding protein [Rubellimicrobium mesophilum]EYD74492.1 hemolysin-type calcium binding protein [Rubellimicrobium mesophilum DSM 19309]
MTYVVDHTLYGQGIVLGTYTEDIDVLEGVGVCSIDSVAIGMWMNDADLNVFGEVLGYGTGAWIVGDNATVTVGGLGTIGANAPEYARGLDVQGGGLSVENDGFIMGYDTAVRLMGGNGTTSTFVNRGNVTGNLVGLFRDLGDSSSVADTVVFTNYGTVNGTEAAIAVHEALDAREEVVNRGYIYGDVSLGLGNDLYDGRGGTVDGRILLGGGVDLAQPGTAKEVLDGGAGQDTLDFGGGPAVVVSLTDPTRNKGTALGDVYTGFEAIIGSSGADTLVGNGANNTLHGRDGADILDGGAGADRLEGGGGNDTYVLTGAGDTLVELAAGGTDQVNSAVSLTLGAQLENLVLTGSSAVSGTGNSLANRLTGNMANNTLAGAGGSDLLIGSGGQDTLSGGAAKDTLTGGLGNDVFVFSSPTEAGDVITDFHNVSGDNDAFRISAAGFGAGLAAGILSASRFQIRADNLARDADDRFIFRTTDATLWFDSNGNVGGGLTMVADLQAGASVTNADILVV